MGVSIPPQPIGILKDLGLGYHLLKSDCEFDHRRIQRAIGRFQLNHGLKITGILDSPTMEMMELRYSARDIIDIRASSPIKAVRTLLRDYHADSDSDSDSKTQSRIKRYHHAIVNEPEPAALSSFTSFSKRSGNSEAAAPSQTLQLGLSVGRYPREDYLKRRACGLRTGGAAVVQRWRKSELSYKFDDWFPEAGKPAVRRAFQTWSEVSIFSFREGSQPDIVIAMCRGDHGDGHPFNAGPGGVLAHAFYPTDGRLHFNVDQPWSYSLDPPPRGRGLFYDHQSVATHEIGHILGLRHIRDRKAVMYKDIAPYEIRRRLTAKDIRKLETLYWSDPNFH